MTIDALQKQYENMLVLHHELTDKFFLEIVGIRANIIGRDSKAIVRILMNDNKVVCSSDGPKTWKNAFIDLPQGAFIDEVDYEMDGGALTATTDRHGRVRRMILRLRTGSPEIKRPALMDGTSFRAIGQVGNYSGPTEGLNSFEVRDPRSSSFIRATEASLTDYIQATEWYSLSYRLDIQYPSPFVTVPREFRIRYSVLSPRRHEELKGDMTIRI